MQPAVLDCTHICVGEHCSSLKYSRKRTLEFIYLSYIVEHRAGKRRNRINVNYHMMKMNHKHELMQNLPRSVLSVMIL